MSGDSLLQLDLAVVAVLIVVVLFQLRFLRAWRLRLDQSQAQSRAHQRELEQHRDELESQVAALLKAVHEASQGNLGVKIPLQEGAVGELGTGLASLTESLRELVRQLQTLGIRITSTTNEALAGVREHERSVTQQAATTIEITATAKEIAATSQEVAANVASVSRVADETSTLANHSQGSIERMASAMQNIQQVCGSFSGKLQVLQEQASHIESVVTTITRVARQSELLSLNAAIEAEKAGEFGRGFHAVAVEIQRLADQAGQGTEDIERLIKEVQSAVYSGVMEMDRFNEAVRRGTDEIVELGGGLSQIVEQVQDMAGRFEQVNLAVQSQTLGARQITEAMEGLSVVAQQTSASLKGSTDALQDLNQTARQMHQSVVRFRTE